MNRCCRGNRSRQTYLIPRPLRLCNLHGRISNLKASISQQECFFPCLTSTTSEYRAPGWACAPAAACKY